MKVHHLNCGTMHPVKGPECVCHVLLLETDNGLVLVDSGFGIDDCADPKGRIGPVRFITRPVFEAAAPQELFDARVRYTEASKSNTFYYSVSADGKRFLVSATTAEAAETPLTVMTNWQEAVASAE